MDLYRYFANCFGIMVNTWCARARSGCLEQYRDNYHHVSRTEESNAPHVAKRKFGIGSPGMPVLSQLNSQLFTQYYITLLVMDADVSLMIYFTCRNGYVLHQVWKSANRDLSRNDRFNYTSNDPLRLSRFKLESICWILFRKFSASKVSQAIQPFARRQSVKRFETYRFPWHDGENKKKSSEHNKAL